MRTSSARAVVAVASGLTTAGLLIVVSELGQGELTSSAIGLLGPLLVGIMLGIVVWLLVPSRRSSARRGATATCASCGAPVMKEWRLCPHCGRFADDDTVESRDVSGV